MTTETQFVVQRSRQILMVFVWNLHLKFGNEIALLVKTRKHMSSCVVWRYFDVAVGTDLWSWPFAREELLTMTTQARLVFGKLSHTRVTRTARRAVLLG